MNQLFNCFPNRRNGFLVIVCLGIQFTTGYGQQQLNDPPVGVILDSVACCAQPDQTYALFLPSTYTEDTTWPVLFIFDPYWLQKQCLMMLLQGIIILTFRRKASFLSELWLEFSPHKIWTLWNASRVNALIGNK